MSNSEKENQLNDWLDSIMGSWMDDSADASADEKPKQEEDIPDESEPEETIPDYQVRKDEQDMYEKELRDRYPIDHPMWMFRHNFMRTGYLPVKVVHHDPVSVNLDEVAAQMVNEAYDHGNNGSASLNHVRFCDIWYKNFGYIYCGYILTPEGQIDVDKFKSDIIKVLFKMNTEPKNLDTLAEHIYKTYISAYKVDAYTETNLIPFKNGDLYIDKDKKGFTFHENQKSAVPYRFGYNFKNIPNCLEPEFPHFAKWRDELFDMEDRFSLQQMLGYLLIPSNEAQEAFFIIGKAGSGKSILTDCIIPAMLGDAQFPISIGQFFDDKFQLGTSEGKLCMVDDDIGEAKLSYEDSGRFKNFVTARTIKIEHKYSNPVKINNSARIVCSGNHMINSDDKTDGFTRRLHPIYVKARVITNVDTRLPRKIEGEIEQIVLWALEGLLCILNTDGVPYSSDRTRQRFGYYSEGQKWEEQFVMDCFTYDEGSVTYSQELRDVLTGWLKDNNEISGEGSLSYKATAVTKWLKDEGADKYGFEYKRGIKKGTKYNARGFIHMKVKEPVKNPLVFLDESGNMKLKIVRKKDE